MIVKEYVDLINTGNTILKGLAPLQNMDQFRLHEAYQISGYEVQDIINFVTKAISIIENHDI